MENLRYYLVLPCPFTARNEIKTVRFGLKLTCNVKSSLHRQDFYFAQIDPTPTGIYYIYFLFIY